MMTNALVVLHLLITSLFCSAQGKDLPQFPSKFTTTIEANIANKNKSIIVEEWYNSDINKAKRVFHHANNLYTYYEDFSNNNDQLWVYKQSTNDTNNVLSCALYPYSYLNRSHFNDETSSSYLRGSQDWLQFSSLTNADYVGMVGDTDDTGTECGDYNMRGLLANKWNQLIVNTTTGTTSNGIEWTYSKNYDINFYFSIGNNWNYAKYETNNSQIPLRVEVNGTHSMIYDNNSTVNDSNYEFYHSYEYIAFFEGSNAFDDTDLDFPIQDWYTECDVSRYCSIYDHSVCSDSKGPSMPTFPLQFQTIVEQTYLNQTYLLEEYYDYINNRAHIIGHYSNGFESQSYHQLDLLDKQQRWFWEGDADLNEDNSLIFCTLTLPTVNLTGTDYFVMETNGHLAKPSQWIHWNTTSQEETWLGYTTVRGIDAEKWQGPYNVAGQTYHNYSWVINATANYYFSVQDWDITYSNASVVPLRMEIVGTYSVYNWSDVRQEYDIDWLNGTINTRYDIIGFWAGEPDNEYFERPENWRLQCTIDQNYCANDQYSNEDVCDDGEDLPSLPQRWKASIEANIVDKNRTWLIEEWYDYNASKARRTFQYSTQICTIFEDFSDFSDERWTYCQTIDDLDSVTYCSLHAYSNATSNFFGNDESNSHHLISSNEWFLFGEEFNETYLGEDYYLLNGIRGITPARAWYRNINSSYSQGNYSYLYNYDLSYYFAPNEWSFYGINKTALGNSDIGVPLRSRIEGTHITNHKYDSSLSYSYTFDHYYDYIGFVFGEYAFDNDDVFNFYNEMEDWIDQCDVSNYCKIYPDSHLCSESKGPELPRFSDSFRMILEANDKISNASYFIEEYYDYSGNRAHIILRMDDDYSGSAMHQLELLDSDQKWFWVGNTDTCDDDELESCYISLSPTNLTGQDIWVQEENGHIARPSKWFHFNDSHAQETWMGYTTVRGIPAEKWKAPYNEASTYANFSYTINATTYYYFSKEGWDITYSNWSRVPLRMEIFGYYSIYNYSSITKSFSTFWKNVTFDTYYDITGFWNGELSDQYFEYPSNWRTQNCMITDDYCDYYPNSEVCYNGPSELPVLPDAFRSTVECNMINHDYTMVIDEFYDYPGNRERIIIYPHQSYSQWTNETLVPYSEHYLENGKVLWKWQQTNYDSVDTDSSTISECSLRRVSQIDDNDFSLWFDPTSEHIPSTNTFLSWVTNTSVEHYIGNDTIRGIPVTGWQHDIISYSTDGESDGYTWAYTTNFTITYYFMSKDYKGYSSELYNNYSIPIRCDLTGDVVIESDGIIYTTYSYQHYYDYINFIVSTPDEFWFTPPSNVSCNFTKFCNDLPEEDSTDYQFYQSLIDLCDDGLVTTECYMSSCGEINDNISGGDGDNSSGDSNTENNCKNNVNIPVWFWFIPVATFVLGLSIGLFCIYKQRKKNVSFNRLDDDL